MTIVDDTGEYVVPREITFSNTELPTKRAVSIIFEDGTSRAVTFYFTYLDYSGEQILEIYWWDSDIKKIGFYGIVEELSTIEVKHPDTGITEFIVLPRSIETEEIVDAGIKSVRMSPRLWIYEVDDL
jgi:hypothetical protein